MATYATSIRQGLPRAPGGPAWPDVEGAVQGEATQATPTTETGAEAPHAAVAPDQTPAATPEISVPSSEAALLPDPVSSETGQTSAPGEVVTHIPLRQGLPRIAGGEPWPPSAGVPASKSAEKTIEGSVAAPATPEPASEAPTAAPTVATPRAASHAAAGATRTEEVALRQGLPRTPGGEPWPAAATVTVQRAISVAAEPGTPPEPAPAQIDALTSDPVERTNADDSRVGASPSSMPTGAETAAPAASSAPATTPALPPPAEKPVPAAAPAQAPAPKPKAAKAAREPLMLGNRTLGQWAKLAVLWGGGAIVAAGIIVLAARGVTTLPGVPEFVQRYPGEYELPEFVDPGFPAWVRWSHFLNFFLIVLIIRSGLLVRGQQKPDAFFTPKRGGKKISIYLWLHTSLDVLWVLNGLAFVILMFITGHWARIVPTSWEVFPNAASAMLQYLTLQWPMENGWVNYNSLQQIMYFTVVFIAAPVAIITGVRMSEWWPEKAEKLNALYPAPIARAIHFPTMLFFVLFILIHVFLVFTTGALKNLNHMFVGTPEVSWLGFWLFAVGLLVTAAVTWAARPLVLAPIANLFGRVSER